MNTLLEHRQKLLVQLGLLCRAMAENKGWQGFHTGITEHEFNAFDNLIKTVFHHNGWFIEQNVREALEAWADALTNENIHRWLAPYSFKSEKAVRKKIAVIGAGNIPMVAMHDILCVYASGNDALVKLSRDDDKLLPALFSLLQKSDDALDSHIEFTDSKLENFDAVIATGSNNSAQYFNYYFGKYPHIIRKNRNSIAILDGNETSEELKKLGNDIFDYFGLGCRNVTKLYVPEDYRFDSFFEAIYDFNPIVHHNKYANNYDYNKAIWLLNRQKLLDNGFLLLKEETALTSPTATLYWQSYKDERELRNHLATKEIEIQCKVGRLDMAFGSTQCPMLWDYADGVDTMMFLSSLS
ncbi:MAG: acyl-CoA reductase [Flavobacteriales bacterium]|nr:acyl-CoA reductase [Flavobacteriales bacterium]